MMGNFMNGGPPKGLTLGFKMNVLTKLHETKTVDNKASMLHYLIKLFQSKFSKEDLVSFAEELNHVKPAKGVSLSSLQGDISDLRKKLAEAELALQNIPKMEGGTDLFHKIVPRGIKKCKEEFLELEKSFEDAVKEYHKTAEVYGESVQLQPEQFFEYISQFMDIFNATVKEIDDAKIKEELAKKREEEAEIKRRVKEEKKRKAEEEKERRRQSSSSKGRDSLAPETEEGVVDSALAQMKSGDVWSAKRKERHQKKKEEDDIMSSIMGTLTNITSKTQEPVGPRSPSTAEIKNTKLKKVERTPSNEGKKEANFNQVLKESRSTLRDARKSGDLTNDSGSNGKETSSPKAEAPKPEAPKPEKETPKYERETPKQQETKRPSTSESVSPRSSSSSSSNLSSNPSSSAVVDDDLQKKAEERERRREERKKQREDEEKKEAEVAEKRREERRKRLEALKQQ